MKKIAFLVLLIPATAFADRLGALKSSADVLLTTQTSLSAGSSNYWNTPTTGTFNAQYGIRTSTLNIGTVFLSSAGILSPKSYTFPDTQTGALMTDDSVANFSNKAINAAGAGMTILNIGHSEVIADIIRGQNELTTTQDGDYIFMTNSANFGALVKVQKGNLLSGTTSQPFIISTISIRTNGPGVLHSIAVSSYVLTQLVSLSTEVIGNLGVANLNSGTNASNTTFWRGDGSWALPASGGGGASTLAVTTGSAVGSFVITSSPTAIVNFSSATFSVRLTGGATAFVELLPSSVTLLGQDVITTSSQAASNVVNQGQYLFVSSQAASNVVNQGQYLFVSSQAASNLVNQGQYLFQSSQSASNLVNQGQYMFQSSQAASNVVNQGQYLFDSSATSTYVQYSSAAASYLAIGSGTVPSVIYSSMSVSYVGISSGVLTVTTQTITGPKTFSNYSIHTGSVTLSTASAIALEVSSLTVPGLYSGPLAYGSSIYMVNVGSNSYVWKRAPVATAAGVSALKTMVSTESYDAASNGVTSNKGQFVQIRQSTQDVIYDFESFEGLGSFSPFSLYRFDTGAFNLFAGRTLRIWDLSTQWFTGFANSSAQVGNISYFLPSVGSSFAGTPLTATSGGVLSWSRTVVIDTNTFPGSFIATTTLSDVTFSSATVFNSSYTTVLTTTATNYNWGYLPVVFASATGTADFLNVTGLGNGENAKNFYFFNVSTKPIAFVNKSTFSIQPCRIALSSSTTSIYLSSGDCMYFIRDTKNQLWRGMHW